jgi:hypothetical protein
MPPQDLALFMTARTGLKVLPYLRKRGFSCELRDPVGLAQARQGDFFGELQAQSPFSVYRIFDR